MVAGNLAIRMVVVGIRVTTSYLVVGNPFEADHSLVATFLPSFVAAFLAFPFAEVACHPLAVASSFQVADRTFVVEEDSQVIAYQASVVAAWVDQDLDTFEVAEHSQRHWDLVKPFASFEQLAIVP